MSRLLVVKNGSKIRERVSSSMPVPSAMPLDTAMNAVRALDISVKHERLIRGEPTDRAAVSVEDVVKREYDRWLTNEDDEQATPALETSDG